MGHGSDVQGLQTVAVLDKENDEFVLNTPNIGATKFWIGEMGVLANYAMVFAQLVVDEEKYGI